MLTSLVRLGADLIGAGWDVRGGSWCPAAAGCQPLVGLDQALAVEPRGLERHAHGQLGADLLAPGHRHLRWPSPGDRAANEGSAKAGRNPARSAAEDAGARQPPATRTHL